ncbi:MAG TPA: phosphatase domain-containing protein [Gemmatimonadaceae bacterium]|nr:phosphatase domain-containing protein [Gemmatimonadaceae bacterium]
MRNYLRQLTHAVRSVFGRDPIQILAYYGYGNASRAHVHGRVLEVRNVSTSTDSDSVFRNLLNTYRRAEADPIPSARVQVEYAGAKVSMTADDEGFFSGWIDLGEPLSGDGEWHDYKACLLAPLYADVKASDGDGKILVPPQTARFGVISDIDDTVIQSRVSNFLQAAQTVMLGNARTRLPFPGVAAFYRALRDGVTGEEKNPIYYVSSSPWNIFDVIAEFMEIQKIPRGPLLLRDWDIGWGLLSSSRHLEHKAGPIRNILKLHPEMQFILIGDSSQHDPEIYREIVAEFPNRVKAIYIRDVTAKNVERSSAVKKLAEEVLAAGSVLVLAEHTLDAAKHAAEQGWINVDALADVGEEKRADEGRDETKAPAPAGGKPSSGKPPVVIESGDRRQIGRP